MFGGTAQHSLTSALFNISRSLFALFGLAFILVVSVYSSTQMATQSSDINTSIGASGGSSSQLAGLAYSAAKQNQYSQSVLFSVYCAAVIIVAYILSRQTSDTATLFRAFFYKHFIKFRKQKSKHKNDKNKKKGNTSFNNFKKSN